MFNNRIFIILALVAVVQLEISSTNGSVIKKRSLAEDLRTGINLAGKIFGFDAASNVADLVARAFTNTNTNPNSDRNQQHGNGKRDEAYANLEPLDDEPQASQHDDHDLSGEINDNVIIDPPSGQQTNIADSPIISGLLKVLGMDSSKLGALAINGIIFIAQMIGRSLMSTFTGANPPVVNSRRNTDSEPQAMNNAFDWIVEKQTSDNELSGQLEELQHRDLTERMVRSIDDGNIRNETNTDCIKLLLCKSAPFVWGMQRAIGTQIREKSGDYEDIEEENDANSNGRESDANTGLNAFFKHLPNVEEFKNHGDACEAQYKLCTLYSILLFPPLNNYKRFLIHKACEKHSELGTFSVGQGINRRVAVYSRLNVNYIPVDEVTSSSVESSSVARVNSRKSSLNWQNPNTEYALSAEAAVTAAPTNTRYSSTSPSNIMGINEGGSGLVQASACIKPLDIYQPPAIRKTPEPDHSDELKTDESVTGQRPRQRRPDRAVYVPRGRRSQTTPPAPAANSTILSKQHSQPQPHHSQSETINQLLELPTISPKQTISLSTAPDVENRFVNSTERSNSLADPVNHYCDALSHTSNNNCMNIIAYHRSAHVVDSSDGGDNSDENNHCNENKRERQISDEKMQKIRANGTNATVATTTTTNDKDYNEEKEFQRASKEINRRNRRIIKQTFNSDILEINDSIPVPSNIDPHLPKPTAKLPPPNASNNKHTEKVDESPRAPLSSSATSAPPSSATTTDSDDWESLFDDNGECLDPKVIDEITASVGKVTITKPKSDYKSYQSPAPINLDAEEFPHVLEISNFPVEFKTPDLMMLFSQYKETGFDIKWVDDTHALAVFSSSKVAAQAINMGHPFVKLKPLTQATIESRARAKKSAAHLQPYRQRPETCAALARRLVTGALGVRLSTAREELENERRVLREAKERKLLAAKQREEAWDNNN